MLVIILLIERISPSQSSACVEMHSLVTQAARPLDKCQSSALLQLQSGCTVWADTN